MVNNIYPELNEKSPDGFVSGLLRNNVVPHDQRNTVYKYMSVATAKLVLSKCSARFSSPLIFNDPFEMSTGFLDFEADNVFLKRKLLEHHTLQECEAILRTIPLNDLKKEYENVFALQQQRALLFCTSLSFSETLMWSHYADNHRGVCLGLLLPTINPDLDMITMNVNYVKGIDPLKVLSSDDTERTYELYRWIFTKSAVWQYEQEVRSFIPNFDNKFRTGNELYYDFALHPNQIAELYFGVSTPAADEQAILDIVREKGYSIEKSGKMEISKATFDLMLKAY